MDEDFVGNAAGSFSSSSKSVVGRNALISLVQQFKDRFRFGLMTFRVSGVSSYYLHNSPYFASYDPISYCLNPPPECATYAKTGDAGARSICQTACQASNPLFNVDYLDEIITRYSIGSEPRDRYGGMIYPKMQRIVNPTDPSNYIYFKYAYPMYAPANYGSAFCYSGGYNSLEGTPWDSYSCYQTKTGTSDGNSGYSNYWFSSQFVPTDSDFAQGYQDFGRRIAWYYIGRTWFSNGSPGGGYLHVSIGDLLDEYGNLTATYNNLLSKFDPKQNNETGYMSCNNGDKNTCSYVINAGLTPTAGTFQTAINYFKGVEGYTSPIQGWCQKNFIIFMTDGLPSVNESGVPGSADSLMPAVLSKIDTLRNITKTISGQSYNFDIQTYVLGVGSNIKNTTPLDQMAVHGGTDVNGHSYYANNPQQLVEALQKVITDIIARSYSFTSPTIPSIRIVDNDTLYISSFIPNGTSFWPGSLKAYRLNSDGTLPVDANGNPLNSPIWTASVPSDRVIKTYTPNAGFVNFTSSYLTPADLGVATTQQRDQIISYVRTLGLGDIFHSNSVIVGSPSASFQDMGFNGTGGFYQNNKNRTKVVIVGANDGMLHAFNASTGNEQWAFIPSEVLTNLQSVLAIHTYYIDSSPKVSDVWFYNMDSDTGATKTADQWRTVLICGLRKGGKTYFALDITDTLNPQYLWQFPKSTDTATLAEVGQSWSEPAIGRVKIEKNGQLAERWVAFIGGGFDNTGSNGRTFFVVDIKTGEIIKEFPQLTGMTYPLAAPPATVDINLDGYVDRVYIGDLGGQMWVFNVSFNGATQKSDSLWTGQRLFTAPIGELEKHSIYYQPAIAFDNHRIPWVYFGTGNRENPASYMNPPERFYAIKDDGSGDYPPRTEPNNLKDVTNNNTYVQIVDPYKGWFIQLYKYGNSLEKVLAKPSVFNRLVYFTTYTYTKSVDLCSNTSSSNLYVVECFSGGGALSVDSLTDFSDTPSQRSEQIGLGAPSTPVISINLKSQGTTIIGTTMGQVFSKTIFSPISKPKLYWREVTQ
jgi:type IV pilus assembly protein PilY1